ncbi:MAG TPA: flagellar hook protein FlgE [Methylocella sp.]|nr:flagellar hook protein FlgE [Methylocella sp.]
MGLFSAMTASVSGMAAQANSLATVSENISNGSTVGYKQALIQFQDLVDQAGVTGDYTADGVTTLVRYNIAERGNLIGTTSPTDLAVQGNGFFLVKDPSGYIFMTRAGSFVPDQNGNLVNSAGYTLMGYNIGPGGAGVTNTVSGLLPVNINGAALVATPSTAGTFTANLNSNAAVLAGLPSTTNYTSKSSLVAYDDLGNAVNLDLYFSNLGGNSWELDVYNGSTQLAGPVTLNFDPTNGHLLPASAVPIPIPVPGGQTVNLDISNSTQLASPFAVTAATVNGNAPSQWQGVTIAPDGTMSYTYTNGQIAPAFQIPLANVNSPDNLTNISGDAYAQSLTSGSLIIGSATIGGLGTIKSSELESSTVDLATQLTDMIVAQRGYESNSKVFQTGAEMLSTLINMLHG